MSADLNAFLRQALASKGKIDIGKFQLLNLDTIKEQLGDNWPTMRKRIFTAAGQFIEKRINRDDIFIACEEGFLIIFTEDGVESDAEVEAISRELEAFFLGSPETAAIKVEGEAKSVEPEDLAVIAAPEPKADAPRPAPAPKTENTAPRQFAPVKLPEEPASEGLAAAFQPIWDSERQAMMANICLAKAHVEGRLLPGRRAIETRMRVDIEHEDLDMTALRGTINALMTLVKKKKKAKFCLTPHYSTLDTADKRAAYLDSLKQLPPPILKAFMIKVDELPAEDPVALAILPELREAGFTTCLQLPFGTTDVEPFADLGVSIFGWDCRPQSNSESEGLLDHDQKTLNAFARSARSAKANTFLGRIRDLRTLKDAMSCGIRFFSGDAVIPSHHQPSISRPFSMVDLYRLNKAA